MQQISPSGSSRGSSLKGRNPTPVFRVWTRKGHVTPHPVGVRPFSFMLPIRFTKLCTGAATQQRVPPCVAERDCFASRAPVSVHVPSQANSASCAVGLRGNAPSQQQCPARTSVVAAGQASSTLHLPMDRDLEEPLQGFDRIEDALSDFAAGKFLVVLDDEDRENEGDLIIAADKVTTAAMAFMVEHTSGVVCIGMEGAALDRLRLPLMISSAENEEAMYTAFTVTVDLRDGITTGISAADRANTIRKLADTAARPEEFRRPGHIFPLRARRGGVLVRPGHTEASVDLARLAGCFPAGALCEIVSKPDGSMARTPELLSFSRTHGLRCIAIADLMRYRLRHERLVTRTASAQLSTRHGPVQAHTFKSSLDGAEHVALVVGFGPAQLPQENVAVQVHAQSDVADLLGLASSSGAMTADEALGRMVEQGPGVLIYMRQAATAAGGVADEVRHLAAVHGPSSTAPAASKAEDLDLCDYGLAAQILADLQVSSVRVSAGNSVQHTALKSCGVLISGWWGKEDAVANGHVSSSNGRVKVAHL